MCNFQKPMNKKASIKNHLLLDKKLPTPKIGIELNILNGNDAEVLAASKLINATNSEVRWGSRNEDNSKIDLVLSFEHPWLESERIILLVQIKSGDSYASSDGENFKVKKKVFKSIKKTANNICLVWLDQKSHKCYWAYIHPNTSVNVTTYGRNHLVSPAFRFEIARCIARTFSGNYKGGKGIIIKNELPDGTISEVRKKLKSIYRSTKVIKNPLLGEINITSLGWKHLFRSSRKKEYKTESYKLIPYIKSILKQYPSNHWISNFSKYERNGYEFLCYEYILKYSEIKVKKSIVDYEVNFKILEEVGYPKNWETTSQLSQKIMRKVTFLSCSLKIVA